MPYNKVIVSGTIAGGEIWSCGMSFGNTGEASPGVSSFEELQDWANAIVANNGGAVVSDDLRALMSDEVFVTQIRTEAVDSNGVTTAAATAAPPTPQAGLGNITKPFQTALVFSLDTGRPGRSYAGRVYWPALGGLIDGSTGRVPATNAADYLDAFVNFVQAIVAAAPAAADLFLAVSSSKLEINTRVNQVRVGDIYDTQRRRRDSLKETYVSQSPS